MKSKTGAPRVLLDTTFILPTLGIETGRNATRGLKILAEKQAEIHYSRFAILESIWVASRFVEDSEHYLERFQLGLRSIMRGSGYLKLDEQLDSL